MNKYETWDKLKDPSPIVDRNTGWQATSGRWAGDYVRKWR